MIIWFEGLISLWHTLWHLKNQNKSENIKPVGHQLTIPETIVRQLYNSPFNRANELKIFWSYAAITLIYSTQCAVDFHNVNVDFFE